MALPPRSRQFLSRIALILFGAAIVYLVGNSSVGLWDRDEPRYAQTSRQMLASGDWIVPRFLDQVRTAKPPLIYWCQAGAMRLLGDTAFAARLPSTIAMLLTLAILAMVLVRAVGRRRAGWTVFILATSLLTIGAAKLCLTDSLLLLWITIAQMCWYRVLRRRASWMTWIVLGIAIALAGLTKGPVVLGVMGTTWIFYRVLAGAKTQAAKRIEFAPAIVCLIVIIAIVAPWLVLIEKHSPGFLKTTIVHDIWTRATSGLEGHRLPPGFYLVTIWITYLPWSVVLPATIALAWRRRRDPLIGFCLAAVVGPWIMFEIVQTKLPLYVLPTIPPLALLTARAVCVRTRQARRTMIAAAVITLAIVGIGYGVVLPRVQILRTSQNLAAILRDNSATHPGDAIMIDYKEPSLAFYQGGTIREESDNQFLEHVNPSDWPRFIVLTRKIWDQTPQISRDRLRIVGEARGWWYVKGAKMVDVLVVQTR